MDFPVDVLEAASHGELERSARTYMNELLYADPERAHYFTLPGGKKVQISLSSVGFVPLYGANLQHKVLALFTPQDQLTAVALFLANQWYCVEDILQTANSRREGLIKVRSVGERLVLYVLNRIVYRTVEMESGDMPFLCHSEHDDAKIFWKNGQAVGFYSVKPKGSICNNSLRQCYFLPVLDSIFVRKAYRGKGYGLQMLEDFVDSFNEDELGLRYPLSPAMTNVCRHYLERYPADVDLFWEVEGVGGPYQRTKVACKLGSRPLNAPDKGDHGEDNGQNGDVVEESGETCLNITEDVIVVNKHHKETEERDTPISTRTRSSEHKRRKRVRGEDGTKDVDSRPDKINRMEMEEVESKEFAPADDVGGEESVTEAPAETPTDVNSKQDEDRKDGAADQDESAIQNNADDDEEAEEMEVETEAGGHNACVQKTVKALDDTTAEQQKVPPVAEENQETKGGSIAHLQRKVMEVPAPEEDTVADQKPEPVAPADRNQEVSPIAEEKHVVVEEQEDPGLVQEQKLGAAKEDDGGAAEEEDEEVSPAEEKQYVADVEDRTEVAPVVEKEPEVASGTEQKEAAAEEEVTSETEDNAEDPKVKKQEVDLFAEETPSSPETDAAGEGEEEEEAVEVSNNIEETAALSSKEDEHGENENNRLTEEDEEEETDEEEGGGKNDVSDLLPFPVGARTKAVHPTSKRTSKRLNKMTVEEDDDDDEDPGEAKATEEDKGMSSEEEKVTTTEEEEEEAEHSSEEEEERVQDPPVIDKRVLRGKTKVIQTTQRTRAKRRGKI